MRYTSRTQFAATMVLSIIGMGELCAASSSRTLLDNKNIEVAASSSPKNSADTYAAEKQKNCAFGHKCDAAPDRSSNFWVSGDFLYWTVCEEGFSCEFGDTTINTTIVDSRPTTAIIENDEDIDFEWQPGVRLGVGVDWPCSGWEIAGYWTHYNGKGDGHDGHNHAKWWLHFTVVDAVIARQFWVGSCVNLKPFTGLRYAQIKQGLRTHLETDIIAATGNSIVTTISKDKEKLWALGPELGLEADFYLGRRWSLYGNLAGAILYGHTKTTFDDIDSFALADNTCKSTVSSCSAQMVLDAGLGLRWEFEHLTLQAGLENHTYFDYNHIGCCGNLNLYGANLSAAFHF